MTRLAVVFALLVACGGPPESSAPSVAPETHTIKGTLFDGYWCEDTDIEGLSVELRNESDELIGATTTSEGHNDQAAGGCRVRFTLAQVPTTSFYSLTIGTHAGPAYSLAEMEANDWKVDLDLD